ncbi:MAG TPA: iron-sulfur cluster repair di-iron protein [Opitutaceae bacterium]|nr:iron-sulfur cluster repair di-iron protein [Opitutaceae bacterium]
MSTAPITAETTVGEIVRVAPIRARILEKLGIDYCCGGKKTLADACRGKQLDVRTVAALLTAIDDAPAAATPNPDALGLAALCDHIEQVHHRFLREELPRLDFMTRKVAAVHGEHEPRLLEVRTVFDHFAGAMVTHTNEEESTVFPAIRQLDADALEAAAGRDALRTMLGKLEAEHDAAGAALARLHELTDGFQPPEWACNTFRALYDGLETLERKTHEHVHAENNILFPRARANCGAV